jgi:hypothetical protein
MRQLQAEEGAFQTLVNACGRHEAMAAVATKLKLCRPQMQRLSLLANFIHLGLVDPEAVPERADITQLRLAVKQILYKELVIAAKGRVQLSEDEEEEAGMEEKPGLGCGGSNTGSAAVERRKQLDALAKRTREAADEEDDKLKKVAEAEMEKSMQQMRLWSSGGDAEERKAQLRTMFAAKYKEFAQIAAKLSS